MIFARKGAAMAKLADLDEVMYSCGMDILHPGGIAKTDEMARMCGIAKDKKVLDVGSGKGITACYLAEKYDCEVTGVDLSEKMVAYARKVATKKGIETRADFRVANACTLPFANESFDIVPAECTTVLLDKEKAFSEFLRVVRHGGYTGDLEMTWRETPPGELVDRTRDLWEGFATMTLGEWKQFCERAGLVNVGTTDFSDTIPDMEKVMKRELGITGRVKMCVKLLFRPDLRRAMNESGQIFRDYGEYIGYGYIVGSKR